MREYKRSIDVAARLGCRWARPLPTPTLSDRRQHVASYQDLADYAAERKVQMLVENFGWMESAADSVADLVKDVGRNVAACPDTGNWKTNAIREAGLKRTFPLAVTCDFKAKTLGPGGEHAAYDLKACFEIGWDAGFRGPWCLEHAHRDRKSLFRELAMLRDQLRRWSKDRQASRDVQSPGDNPPRRRAFKFRLGICEMSGIFKNAQQVLGFRDDVFGGELPEQALGIDAPRHAGDGHSHLMGGPDVAGFIAHVEHFFRPEPREFEGLLEGFFLAEQPPHAHHELEVFLHAVLP